MGTLVDSKGASMFIQGQLIVHGSTISLPSYIAETATDLGKNVVLDEQDDAAGALAAILVYKRQSKWSVVLACKSDATLSADFPEGNYSTISGLTSWWVDSATAAKSKGVMKATVNLTYKGV
jgi:hypothetical protein